MQESSHITFAPPTSSTPSFLSSLYHKGVDFISNNEKVDKITTIISELKTPQVPNFSIIYDGIYSKNPRLSEIYHSIPTQSMDEIFKQIFHSGDNNSLSLVAERFYSLYYIYTDEHIFKSVNIDAILIIVNFWMPNFFQKSFRSEDSTEYEVKCAYVSIFMCISIVSKFLSNSVDNSQILLTFTNFLSSEVLEVKNPPVIKAFLISEFLIKHIQLFEEIVLDSHFLSLLESSVFLSRDDVLCRSWAILVFRLGDEKLAQNLIKYALKEDNVFLSNLLCELLVSPIISEIEKFNRSLKNVENSENVEKFTNSKNTEISTDTSNLTQSIYKLFIYIEDSKLFLKNIICPVAMKGHSLSSVQSSLILTRIFYIKFSNHEVFDDVINKILIGSFRFFSENNSNTNSRLYDKLLVFVEICDLLYIKYGENLDRLPTFEIPSQNSKELFKLLSNNIYINLFNFYAFNRTCHNKIIFNVINAIANNQFILNILDREIIDRKEIVSLLPKFYESICRNSDSDLTIFVGIFNLLQIFFKKIELSVFLDSSIYDLLSRIEASVDNLIVIFDIIYSFILKNFTSINNVDFEHFIIRLLASTGSVVHCKFALFLINKMTGDLDSLVTEISSHKLYISENRFTTIHSSCFGQSHKDNNNLHNEHAGEYAIVQNTHVSPDGYKYQYLQKSKAHGKIDHQTIIILFKIYLKNIFNNRVVLEFLEYFHKFFSKIIASKFVKDILFHALYLGILYRREESIWHLFSNFILDKIESFSSENKLYIFVKICQMIKQGEDISEKFKTVYNGGETVGGRVDFSLKNVGFLSSNILLKIPIEKCDFPLDRPTIDYSQISLENLPKTESRKMKNASKFKPSTKLEDLNIFFSEAGIDIIEEEVPSVTVGEDLDDSSSDDE